MMIIKLGVWEEDYQIMIRVKNVSNCKLKLVMHGMCLTFSNKTLPFKPYTKSKRNKTKTAVAHHTLVMREVSLFILHDLTVRLNS